jgi:hypothetical protein
LAGTGHVIHFLPDFGATVFAPKRQTLQYTQADQGDGREADCFKYRNKIGLDVAVEGLREYREKKRKPNYKALLEFARMNRVEKVMMPYLDALR